MRILIVGGGTGGTVLANNLARRLAVEIRTHKVRLTMLTASDKHLYQPGLLYVAFGQMTPDQLYRDQAGLLESSVEFHVDPVVKFQLDQKQVVTKSGKTYEYDILIIATGSRIVPNEVPGLEEGSENFYTVEGAVRLRKRLMEFEGGTIAMVVSLPHKCPVAPVEAMFMLHDFFKARGIRDKVRLRYHYPVNKVHATANVAVWAKPEFDKAGIEYDLTEQSMMYAHIATGFKQGGLNTSAPPTEFEPEELVAYEFGSKNRFFENKMQMNLEAFYYQYDNMQAQMPGPVNIANTGSEGFIFFTYSAPNVPGQDEIRVQALGLTVSSVLTIR
jgi:hypothetical protein